MQNKNKTNKTKKILLLSTAIILLLAINSTPQMWSKQSKLHWYDVEDWEVEACSKWGGRTESQQSETFQAPASYGDITITIQARKTKTQNATLYEVTYYMESYSLTTDYKIKLANKKTSETTEITRGTIEPESGGATDYWTQTLPEDYDTAIIEYAKGKVIVPIIKN